MKKNRTSSATTLNQQQQQMVIDHMEFAKNIGKKNAGLALVLGLTVEDIEQEACYGLCVAALFYDPTVGASFQTFAYDWCEKYVHMALRSEFRALTVDKFLDFFANTLPEEPSLDEHALQKIVKEVFHMLNTKERMVIRRHLGFNIDGPKTFRQIAREMNLSVGRVRDIYDNAVERLAIKYKKESQQ